MLVGVLRIVGGLFFLGGSVQSYLRQREVAERFLPVGGTVLESKVRTRATTDGPPTYWPEVRYAYEIGDQRYVGARYSFYRGGSEDYRAVRSQVETRYAPGREITVYIDPERPGVSVLDGEAPDGRIWPVALFALVFVAGGILLVWQGLRRARRGGRGIPSDGMEREP